jgi:hypothetical protein
MGVHKLLQLEWVVMECEVARDLKGQFQFGHIGLPGAGRPQGSRPKLSALFWNDLYAVWQAKGMGVLERLADEDPASFAKIAAMLVGKAEDVVRDDARDAAVEAFIEERRQQALKMIAKMDGVADAQQAG